MTNVIKEQVGTIKQTTNCVNGSDLTLFYFECFVICVDEVFALPFDVPTFFVFNRYRQGF